MGEFVGVRMEVWRSTSMGGPLLVPGCTAKVTRRNGWFGNIPLPGKSCGRCATKLRSANFSSVVSAMKE